MATKFVPKNASKVEALALPAEVLAEDSQYLNQLLEQRKSLEVAINSFGNYLHGKYKLEQGDQITLDGKIVRKS